jgi:hypothetical protein
MLLTISTTHQPATDLGHLLHKNPTRLQTEDLSFGKAYVFYPDASVDLCTAALLIEIDPVALVRGRGAENILKGNRSLMMRPFRKTVDVHLLRME